MSPFELHVRTARTDDAARLAELAGQLGYDVDEAQMRRGIESLASEPAHAVIVVENSARGVIGWIHVGRRFALLSEPAAEIYALIVDESCRARGVGKRLMQAAEAWARQQGLAMLRVRCNVLRAAAQGFYGNLGYELTKSQGVFDKRL